jgi:hypothetical protein
MTNFCESDQPEQVYQPLSTSDKSSIYDWLRQAALSGTTGAISVMQSEMQLAARRVLRLLTN